VDSAENILQAPLELKGCAVAYLFFTIWKLPVENNKIDYKDCVNPKVHTLTHSHTYTLICGSGNVLILSVFKNRKRVGNIK
jgi:hypothetical protein